MAISGREDVITIKAGIILKDKSLVSRLDTNTSDISR